MYTATQLRRLTMAHRSAKMTKEQRVFYFTIGFGSIVAVLANPPGSMLWMAIINVLGIGLVSLSIIGRRIFTNRQESGLRFELKQISCVATGLLGVSLPILAISLFPTSLMTALYMHIMGIILVTHALLHTSSLFPQKPSLTFRARSGHSDTPLSDLAPLKIAA